jgi:ATP-dependent Clp protease ATP-binding subunit ClpC
MFESYTEDARNVMSRARQEAQKFGHDHIGTEHILLGMLEVKACVAADVLRHRTVDLPHAKALVEKLVTPGAGEGPDGTLPRTKHAQHVLDDAIKEARRLKHSYIGTEHLLLGLLYEKDCIATEVLGSLGLKLNEVREDVLHFAEQRKNAVCAED